MKKEASPQTGRELPRSAGPGAGGDKSANTTDRASDEVYDYSYLSSEATGLLGEGTMLVRDVLDQDLYLIQFYKSSVPIGRGQDRRTLALWVKSAGPHVASRAAFDATLLKRTQIFPANADRMMIALVPKGERIEYFQRAATGANSGASDHQLLLVKFHKRWIVRIVESTASVPEGRSN